MQGSELRQLIPWWGRIAAKLVLSRLPIGYPMWRKLSLFRHGCMHDAAYALEVFQMHFGRVQTPAERGFVALELGPGDSLGSAIIAAAHGATCTHLVDVGPFATTELAVYQQLCRYLSRMNLQAPSLESVQDTSALLQVCRATYGTRGLASLREVPSASVDFLWSHAVLEHVRRADFTQLIRETRRVMRPEGMCSHQIDLQDHLGGALNNLRIPSRWWESEWMARSGFYTNRMRMAEIIRVFESAGFRVSALTQTRWNELPTPLAALAPEFRAHDRDDLLVKSFCVTLTPDGGGAS
jgi:hypothetical protein